MPTPTTLLAICTIAAGPVGQDNWNRMNRAPDFAGPGAPPVRPEPMRPVPASFDYGGVCRANTGVGEAIPPALRLEPDEEWTVTVWVRNMEPGRSTPLACAFWGDNAFHPIEAHIFALFVYYDGGASPDHGNVVAWIHGTPVRMGDSTMPLDDDEWHLVAVRNRNDMGTYRCSVSADGGPWMGEVKSPDVSMSDATLPWSLNSMHDSRFAVPWIRRRDCKLDELVLFNWALDDDDLRKLHHNGRPRLPGGGGGLYSLMESPGKVIMAHYMFGGEGADASTTTLHRSYTDLHDADLCFVVEGAGAGVIDTDDFPGAP